jgi:hypothetical protein
MEIVYKLKLCIDCISGAGKSKIKVAAYPVCGEECSLLLRKYSCCILQGRRGPPSSQEGRSPIPGARNSVLNHFLMPYLSCWGFRSNVGIWGWHQHSDHSTCDYCIAIHLSFQFCQYLFMDLGALMLGTYIIIIVFHWRIDYFIFFLNFVTGFDLTFILSDTSLFSFIYRLQRISFSIPWFSAFICL